MPGVSTFRADNSLEWHRLVGCDLPEIGSSGASKLSFCAGISRRRHGGRRYGDSEVGSSVSVTPAAAPASLKTRKSTVSFRERELKPENINPVSDGSLWRVKTYFPVPDLIPSQGPGRARTG